MGNEGSNLIEAHEPRRILSRLDEIRREHCIAIPLAVESGSRAWGFPSPDSDYDCRFIFVRPSSDYLSPWQRRDVIETPIEGALDVNGWDLGKALKLLLKGNAVIVEWLTSPIAYINEPAFRDAFLDLARHVSNRDLIGRHYLHLGERQRRSTFCDEKEVPLKKLFYAIRPAAALRWLRAHPAEAVAPMHFPTLMASCDMPREVREIVDDLLVKKAATRELGTGPLSAPLAAFIDDEFALARRAFARPATPVPSEHRKLAETLFRETVKRWDEGSSADPLPCRASE